MLQLKSNLFLKLTGMLTESCAAIKIKLFLTLEGTGEVGVLPLAKRDWT